MIKKLTNKTVKILTSKKFGTCALWAAAHEAPGLKMCPAPALAFTDGWDHFDKSSCQFLNMNTTTNLVRDG